MLKIPNISIRDIIHNLKTEEPDKAAIFIDKKKISRAELYDQIILCNKKLISLGFKKKDKLLSLMDNSFDQIVIILSCLSLGIVWVPLGKERKGIGLNYIVNLINPKKIIVQNKKKINVQKKFHKKILLIKNFKDILVDNKTKVREYSNNISCILFTSGTTGPPKGVIVSDKMLITSAYATGLACDVKANDRFLLWESLHHIGGLEILIISLLKKTQLFLVKKFSARNFWKQVRKYKISKFHYLGGILDILVKQPSQKTDHKHNIKLGFGAGARKNTIKIFNKRFKIPLREVYGMTEASSFTTINFNRINNSIGKVLPWFKIKLINISKNVGEIFIKEISKNVISKGYYGDIKSTSKVFKNNGFYTGDIAKKDKYGNFYFIGRKKDSVRIRGENISCWEIETNLNLHKDISESAILSTDADIGEEEMVALIIKKKNKNLSIKKISNYFKTKLNKNYIPRYWTFVDEFPRTPTLRIDKKNINISILKLYDSHRNIFIINKI